MTRNMTPPEMTDGQIENAVNKFRDAMRKHSSKVTLEVAQRALSFENFGMMMFTSFCEFAEAVSSSIVRKVSVDHSRSPRQVLRDTGCVLHIDNDMVVNSMPKSENNITNVVFFKLQAFEFANHNRKSGLIHNDDLLMAYNRRSLKPVDPFSLATANEVDFTLVRKIHNCTIWKNAKGKWCYMAFYMQFGERRVLVARKDDGWDDSWWFAGVHK